VTVERDGELVTLDVPEDFFGRLISNRMGDFSRSDTHTCGRLSAHSPAREAGVLVGDHVLGSADMETWSFDEFAKVIGNLPERNHNDCGTGRRQLDLEIAVSEEGRIGAYAKPVTQFLEFETRNYSFFESVPAGIGKAYSTTTGYFRELRLLFRPEVKVSESLGGFITIGSIFRADVGLDPFLDHYRLPFHHPGHHECIANSGAGWWPRDVPGL
jgi:regulator of sigma E protease